MPSKFSIPARLNLFNENIIVGYLSFVVKLHFNVIMLRFRVRSMFLYLWQEGSGDRDP